MIKSFALTNFNDVNYFMCMDWEEGIETITYTMEQQLNKEVENKRFELYTSIYPLIVSKQIKEMSYQDFIELIEGNKVENKIDYSNKTDEEMLKEIEELENLERLKKGGK